jgi:hypothetical protein
MSFGFPAYSTGSQRFNLPQPDLQRVITQALGSLGWSYETPSPNTFVARNSVNWWSWGEKITAEVASDGTLTVRSECLLVTQCIDWGKNSRNVKAFFDAVSRSASQREVSGLPVATYDEESRTPLERVINEGEKVER